MHSVEQIPVGKMESRNGYFFYRLNQNVVIVEDESGVIQSCLQSRRGIAATVLEAIIQYDGLLS